MTNQWQWQLIIRSLNSDDSSFIKLYIKNSKGGKKTEDNNNNKNNKKIRNSYTKYIDEFFEPEK